MKNEESRMLLGFLSCWRRKHLLEWYPVFSGADSSFLRMTEIVFLGDNDRDKKIDHFQLENLHFMSRLSVEFSQMNWDRVSHKHTRYCVIESTLSTTCCQNFFKNCSRIVFIERTLPLFDFFFTYVVHRFFTFWCEKYAEKPRQTYIR